MGQRKEGLMGGGRGWKVKTGEEGEDRGEDIGEESGEEKVEMVEGETGESCSEPEREEEEPETNTDKEDRDKRKESRNKGNNWKCSSKLCNIQNGWNKPKGK